MHGEVEASPWLVPHAGAGWGTVTPILGRPARRAGPPPGPLVDARTAEVARALLRQGRHTVFLPGQTVLCAGMPVQVHYVESGCITIAVKEPDGRERAYGLLGPGSLDGEVAAVRGVIRAHTYATVRTETYRWEVDAFRDLVRAYPEVAAYTMGQLARKAHMLLLQAEALRRYCARERVISCLLSLADAFGRPTRHGVEVTLPLTQGELGSLAAASRVTVNRVLSELHARGLVETAPQRLVFRDPEALRAELPPGYY